MNGSRFAIFILLLLGIAVAVVLSLSRPSGDRGILTPPAIEPREVPPGTVEIDVDGERTRPGEPDTSDPVVPPPATRPETTVHSGGNLPARGEAPVPPEPGVGDGAAAAAAAAEAAAALKARLQAIAMGDVPEAEAREELVRSLPALSTAMDDELALALTGSLDRFLDPGLDKRVVAMRELYAYPLVRAFMRERVDPGVVAAVIRQESRLADADAITWLDQSQLVAPEDVFHGVTRYLSVVGTLIRNADPAATPDCDASIVRSLRSIRKLLAEGGDIDLREVIAPKLEGLAPERLGIYEALFDE